MKSLIIAGLLTVGATAAPVTTTGVSAASAARDAVGIAARCSGGAGVWLPGTIQFEDPGPSARHPGTAARPGSGPPASRCAVV